MVHFVTRPARKNDELDIHMGRRGTHSIIQSGSTGWRAGLILEICLISKLIKKTVSNHTNQKHANRE
jgi:hypothetical protein